MHDVVPSKPLSAYMLYFRAKHAQTPNVTVTDFAKETGAEWKALSDADKKPFNDAAKQQRDLYEKQVAFCLKEKAALVGENFLDSRKSSQRAGKVVAYDAAHEKDDDASAGLCYSVSYDDGATAQETISLGELRARVCGDEKATKRKANATSEKKPPRKRKSAEKAARTDDDGGDDGDDDGDDGDGDDEKPSKPPPRAAAKKVSAPAPKKHKAAAKAKEPDAPPVKKPKKPDVPDGPQLSEEEILNVIRLSRRLVGGACIANLKKMCAAAGLLGTGSKPLLSSRLEYFLRSKAFQDDPFQPSAADVETLSIDEFNEKYQDSKAYTIKDIEKLLKKLADADDVAAPAAAEAPAAAAEAPAAEAPAAEAPAAAEEAA